MKAIVFDFDGTLYSCENPLKKIIDQRTVEFLHNNSVKDIESLEQRIPNILEALDYLSLEREKYIEFVYDDLKYNNCLKEDRILNGLLTQIFCPKIVVSLSPKKHLMAAMAQLNILSFFDEIVSMCDILQSVNKKSVYLSILKKNGWNAKNVMCVGDSYEIDLMPAKQLGMTVFLCSGRAVDDKNVKSFNDIKVCLAYILDSQSNNLK
ncbi:MAG: HAD family hydrolase [Candidatus Methanofastidiosa archaeon]|nr:HAD family hydrolase [Candidatus Methanofastidiosa archaeon]